jgi:hypothetical protein
MAMKSYIESFARAYAEKRIHEMAVSVDRDTGAVLLSFHGRHVSLSLREVALQEEAFQRLGAAVDNLLGIEPSLARTPEPVEVGPIGDGYQGGAP